MLIGNIINDSFGLLSKQLRFYCWHFRRNLDQKQRQELTDLLYEQHFERLANKIKSLNQSSVVDCKQQISKLLFEHCLSRNRRHQLIQLIKSRLVDINIRLDNYGRTLLHRTAYSLDVELVKVLIDHGVNIRLRDYAGNTALHIAIQSYRNGYILYGDGPYVVQNLTSIITLLLEADRVIQNERHKSTLNSLSSENNSEQNWSTFQSISKEDQDIILTENINSPNQKQSHNDNLGDLVPSARKQSSTSSPDMIDRPKDQPNCSADNQTQTDSISKSSEDSLSKLNPILLEDSTTSLVDTKNAFGRTALHYCVLVVGESHLAHFVKLLISFGADTDAIDTRMKTPLYCLVKRTGVSAIRQKCAAITHLLESGCDDLGLAIEPKTYFNEKFITDLEGNLADIMQPKLEGTSEPIFTSSSFKRVPKLKHLARLRLVKLQDEKTRLRRQTKLSLPYRSPKNLNLYVNRRLLDQSELF